MNKRRFKRSLLATVTAALFAGGGAHAQDKADTSSGGIEEIVVTAQRRAESAQAVPIAITALSSRQLESAGIQTTQDIAIMTPGLTMTQTRDGVVPYLRGVGSQSSTTEGAVGVYVDNVYFASSRGAIFTLNNIERIEVLKGPQGTLFGRSATGGLVNVITRDPSYALGVKGSIGYANYDTLSGNLYVTGGLTDTVAMDVAFAGSHQGKGWGKNLFLGGPANIRREWAVRSKLKIDAFDNTKIIVTADYSRWRTDIGSTRQPLQGTVAAGGFLPPASIYDVNQNLPAISRDPAGFGKDPRSWQGGVSAKIEHDFSERLALTSITAYRKGASRSYLDSDFSPRQVSDVYFNAPARTFQQDLLLNNTGDRLQWTAGCNYFSYAFSFSPQVGRTIPGSLRNNATYSTDYAHSYALFGQGTYDFAQGTSLTLGTRYTRDKLRDEAELIATAGSPFPVGTVISSTDQSPRSRTHKRWNALTWRVALDHKITDNIMVYASTSKGYKAGTFSISGPPVPLNVSPAGDAVDPEKLYAYEIGFKSDLFDRQLRANGAMFFYDYRNIQLLTVVPAGGATRYFNAKQGKIYGSELEVIYSPRMSQGNLQIRGAATLLDPKYGKFPNAPFYIPNPPAVGGNTLVNCTANPAGCDATGKRMIRTSRISTSVGVDYSLPVSERYEAAFNLTWQHTGKFYFEVDNRLAQPAYDWINGQVSFTRDDGAWRLRLWARNITGAKYYVSINAQNTGDGASPGAPRTFGVALDFKFGG